MREKKASEAMDPSTPEKKSGVPASNHQRPCWAIKQLISEVQYLFPETLGKVQAYNQRNVGLAVRFSAAGEGLPLGLDDLLALVVSDVRVSHVHTEIGHAVTVTLHNRPRTYDLRDQFGLNEAWLVLVEKQDPDYSPDDQIVFDDVDPDYRTGGGSS